MRIKEEGERRREEERRGARLTHRSCARGPAAGGACPLVPALGVGQRQAAGDEAHPERDALPVSVEGRRLRCQRVRGAGPEPRGLGRRGLPADLGHRRALGHVGGGLAHVLHCKQRGDREPRSALRVPAGCGFRRARWTSSTGPSYIPRIIVVCSLGATVVFTVCH